MSRILKEIAGPVPEQLGEPEGQIDIAIRQAELQVALEAELQAAAEAEVKKHLARELHDRVAQTLTTMVVEMETFKIEQVGRQSVIEGLNDLQESTREVLNSLRRMLYELRGEPVIDQDFAEAVRGMLSRFGERTRIQVDFRTRSWPRRLPAPVALNLYRILEEALSNVRRHSGASSIEVLLDAQGENALLQVADNGVGLPGVDEVRTEGLGTVGMRERAVLLGGKLRVESRGRGGTLVEATFPKGVLE